MVNNQQQHVMQEHSSILSKHCDENGRRRLYTLLQTWILTPSVITEQYRLQYISAEHVCAIDLTLAKLYIILV